MSLSKPKVPMLDSQVGCFILDGVARVTARERRSDESFQELSGTSVAFALHCVMVFLMKRVLARPCEVVVVHDAITVPIPICHFVS